MWERGKLGLRPISQVEGLPVMGEGRQGAFCIQRGLLVGAAVLFEGSVQNGNQGPFFIHY